MSLGFEKGRRAAHQQLLQILAGRQEFRGDTSKSPGAFTRRLAVARCDTAVGVSEEMIRLFYKASSRGLNLSR